MKKKIVNVLLSAAVVTTMMFTATACGSKDSGSTPVEPAAANSVADAEPSSEAAVEPSSEAAVEPSSEADEVASSEAGQDADAADNMTVEEWVNSEEAATFIDAINSVYEEQGMTMELEAEGDTLSMILIYSEELLGTDGSDLTDEQMEAVQTLMEQQFEGISDQLVSMGDVLKEEVGAAGVRISFHTINGTELYSQDL